MLIASFSKRPARFVLAWAAAILIAGADDPKPTPARSNTPVTPAAAQALADGFDPEVAKALAESWPDRPEWVDMLADILQGSQMGPNSGWFRTAVTQTRFGWDSTRKRLDRDGDGQISRKEFPGPDADFARLARNRDAVVTESNFDFSQQALAPSPGLIWFSRADADGNGKVTREEFDALFKSFDSGGQGFLSQTDLIDALTPMSRVAARPSGALPVAPRGGGGPSKATLVRGLFNQEIGSLQPGPKLDDIAPDFTLKTNDGKSEITLSKLVGPKPIVLIFGNFTCGPFRSHSGNFDKLHERYKDRATFVMVYVREAHPTDGWRMESNDRIGVSQSQPRTYEERVEVAKTCGKHLNLGFPMLVDTIDDRVGAEYSGMPGRFYLIDHAGKVAFKNGRGPFGFKPAELEHSLILLLQHEAAQAGEPKANVSMLDDAEAWRLLPRAEMGGGQPLPNWARALARSLPRTTAAMLDLDRLHRTRSPLGLVLRGKMRWAAADANRCGYSRAYAEADLRRAGVGEAEIKTLAGDHSALPEPERAALKFARQMTLEADKVTDEEVAFLKSAYGENKLAAMVLLLANANFQDRLLLALDAPIEPGGPRPPLEVRFAKGQPAPPVPARFRPEGRPAPPVPERVDDPDWQALDIDDLRKGLDTQRSNVGRIRVPSWEEVVKGLPADYPVPKNPSRIKWSLVCMGYQPELAIAWSACTRAFGEEAKQDRVFEESLFWVVTREIHCFY